MKTAFRLVIPGIALCLGCAASSAPGDTGSADVFDVAAPDAVGDDGEVSIDDADVGLPDAVSDVPDSISDATDGTDTTVCEQTCLGACASARFDAPAGDCVGYSCEIDPGITGFPHPIPGGGWLLESSPALCVTDTDAWRLSILKSDGTFEILQKREINMMNADQTLPSLVSAQADRYFLIQDGCPYSECRAELATQYATLGAWKYDDRAPLWKIGGPELQNGNLASVVAVDADRIWVLSTAWNEGNIGHSHLIAVNFDGTVANTFEIPGGGWLKSALAGQDRFLLIFRSTVAGEETKTESLYAFSVDRMGVVTGPTDLDTVTLDANEWFGPGFMPLRTGIFVEYMISGSNGQARPDKAFVVNLDGTVRWTHEGKWADADVRLSPIMLEMDDGQIGVIPNSNNEFQKIAADGQSITDGIAIPAPTAESRWWVSSIYFRNDGILVGGAISKAQHDYTLFVALYSDDFSTLLWSRVYGDNNQPGWLLPDGDGWMVWYDRCIPWIINDGGEFSCGERCASTYLHFDSVCGE